MVVDHDVTYAKLDDDHVCIISDDIENITFHCYSYHCSILKTIIYYLCCLLTVGFLLLVCYWKPRWKLVMTHSKCSLVGSSKVFITDQYDSEYVEDVVTVGKKNQQVQSNDSVKFIKTDDFVHGYKYFLHKKFKYFYSFSASSFQAVVNIEHQLVCSHVYDHMNGFNEYTRNLLLDWFGSNMIDVEVKSYIVLFFEECANPFYIFQIFSCILWFSDDYYYYAGTIVFISLSSIFVSIYQTHKHITKLRNMIARSETVNVLDVNGEEKEILSDKLVPGDILVIPKFTSQLFCDAVLLSGTVIVNESMLTGESVPVTKTPFPRSSDSSFYNSNKYKNHTLFCGTDILQTRYYTDEKVLAMVVKTGFSTLKGGLIRSILFPKPVDFKFFNDALKFVGILSIFAVGGLSYSIYASYENGLSIGSLIKKSLDVITIAVPPALPAAMTIGTVYSLQRLTAKQIYCISPSHINISGKIKLFCFDKTGTLTEDGLKFCGVIPAGKINALNFEGSLEMNPSSDQIIYAMATCHSLTIIDKQICGDPLDLQMFHSTGWEVEEGGSDKIGHYGHIISTIVKPTSSSDEALKIKFLNEDALPLEIAILKQYTFSSELQRMSVIVRKLGSNNMDLYAKGSPEMICSLCDTSTIMFTTLYK